MATATQRNHNHHHQIYAALVLSIVLLLTRNVNGRVAPPLPPQQQQYVGGGGGAGAAGVGGAGTSQALLTELLTSANDNNGFYNELQRYRERQPNYLAKWPGLRDLLLTAYDYDTNNNNDDNNNGDINNMDVPYSRFFERLWQLADNSAGDLIEDARDDNNNNGDINTSSSSGSGSSHNLTPNAAAIAAKTFKEHGTKKNAQFRKQYMSPCHFKICNMGRKRNALIFDY